jgi:hypothetical protein
MPMPGSEPITTVISLSWVEASEGCSLITLGIPRARANPADSLASRKLYSRRGICAATGIRTEERSPRPSNEDFDFSPLLHDLDANYIVLPFKIEVDGAGSHFQPPDPEL